MVIRYNFQTNTNEMDSLIVKGMLNF